MAIRIEGRPIEAGSEDYARFVETYNEAFPPDEQLSLDDLMQRVECGAAELTAYYADGRYCGFSYCIEADSYLYVLFLAVAAQERSRGIGSLILGQLRDRFPDKVFVLEIEPLDDDAPNAAQRARRLAFYERNGFMRTGYDLYEDEMRYTVLATSLPFDPVGFLTAVHHAVGDVFPMELRPSI